MKFIFFSYKVSLVRGSPCPGKGCHDVIRDPGFFNLLLFHPNKLACSPPPVFVNKVLLEHRHAHLFTYCLSCILTTELSSCHREHMAHKAKNSYYLTLKGKRLLNPVPGHGFCLQIQNGHTSPAITAVLWATGMKKS